MQRLIRITLLASVAIGLAACAGNVKITSVDEILTSKGLVRGEIVNRISNHQIHGWQTVNDENLIITTGVNDAYLISLQSPCYSLRSAYTIGYTSHMSSLDKFDRIVIRDIGNQQESCQIKQIQALLPAEKQD